jgi:transmembrane sensor
MKKEDYILLYEKYVSGQCTAEEKELLELYRDDFEWIDAPWDAKLGDQQEIRNKIYNRLETSIGEKPIPLYSTRKRWPWMAAAAILLGTLAIGLIWRQGASKLQLADAKKHNINYKNDIPPGGNKAVLTLANGVKVILNKAQNGTILKQGQTAVDKTKDGQLVYVSPATGNNALNTAITYNTVTTPNGGQYEVVLADGTKVWLNAASSLKFPTAFTGNERNVELTGEGYFEVAKNKEKPFKVKINNAVIEVLGTHFNIMGYANEPVIKTTLLEGSVKMKRNGEQVLLVPGQQALAFNDNNVLKVQQADIEETMAWKNGQFIFHNENIQDIMRKVARWYDVDIQYQGNVKDKAFGGSVSRFSNISELLKNLELTETIHFKIEGRSVIVME